MNKKFLIISIIVTAAASISLALGTLFINLQREGSYEQYQNEVDEEYEEMSASYMDDYPILSGLPEITADWRVDYGNCETSANEFCLMISANNPTFRQEALDFIKQSEYYEEGKYNIEFFELIWDGY